jgi:hypothetical protein
VPDIFVRFKEKFGASREIFIEVPTLKFYLNSSFGRLAVTCGWADEQRDRQTDRQAGRQADIQTDRQTDR